ncbi:MAG TPA: M4 family metallopeptidase, partial [Thermoanaerobaculia bacterium]|nr:M4 family metallopeptidase [Thermoanaerobaculia bacterium]
SLLGLPTGALVAEAEPEVDSAGASQLRLRQFANGLEVVGGDVAVSADETGHIYAVFGDPRPSPSVPPQPSINPQQAIQAVMAARPLDGALPSFSRLVYFVASDQSLHLAFEIRLIGTDAGQPVEELYYVDGFSGLVIESQSVNTQALNRFIYHAGNGWFLPGALWRAELWAPARDFDVNTNFNYLGGTYSFYRNFFGRDSWNGRGAAINSTVHYGVGYNDAFWNGRQITFGDGDGVRTAFLARAFDLTVHEFTHGVTQTTAGLIYRGQSGALNEGTSDIMAAVATAWAAGGAIGPNVWKIGEDVYTPLIAGDAARYMDNPILSPTGGRDWYPTRYTGAQDNGGVHWNSGIANLAFKLMVTGGRHPRLLSPVVVPALGMNLAARIWYRALTRYLPANATFRTARYATARAAFDLTRNNAVSNAVHRAWDAVGVPR